MAVEAALQDVISRTEGSYVIEEVAAGVLPLSELPLPQQVEGRLPAEWLPVGEHFLQHALPSLPEEQVADMATTLKAAHLDIVQDVVDGGVESLVASHLSPEEQAVVVTAIRAATGLELPLHAREQPRFLQAPPWHPACALAYDHAKFEDRDMSPLGLSV